jgi:tetratricopeptide (TPR) repeat protein
MLFFLPLIFLISAYSCKNADAPNNQNTNLAATDTTSNEIEKLLDEINQKIVSDPNNVNFYHQRAYIHYRAGNFEAALKDIDRCISLDSTQAAFYFTRGEIYFSKLNLEEAKNAYLKCSELNPKDWQSQYKIGRIFFLIKNFQKALEHTNNALKINKNIAEIYYQKGEIFEELKDSAKAVSSFQTAIEQDPNYYDAYIRLGILFANRKDKMALQYYNSALQIQPDNIEALYNKAYFCQETGLYDEALNTYDTIIGLKQNYEIAWHNKGYIYLVYLNAFDKAIACFNKAIEINPAYYSAYHNRGLAYESKGDYKQARENYKSALKINPTYDLSALALENLDKKQYK